MAEVRLPAKRRPGWPIWVSSAATTRSAIIESSKPPAIAYPWSWAMVTFCMFQKYSQMSVTRAMPPRMPMIRPVAVFVDGAELAVHGVGAVAAGGCEVVAGGEGPAGALDDQDADVVVGFEVFERIAEVVDELLREGVHLLGAVERDPADAVVGPGAVEQHVFEGGQCHLGSPHAKA